MANLIQIKRSTANATVTGLANGELAFTQSGNTLHIGLPDGSGVLRIGGAQYPGTLTASHALVANSTSGIDKIITANLVADSIWDGSSSGADGYVLTADGSGGFAWEAGASGTLEGLSDTTITSPGTGSLLLYNGSSWIDNTMSGDATLASTGALTLATSGVTAATYGNSSYVGVFTVDAKGRVTSASNTQINHDALQNFVSDEHVAHTSVVLTAGDGLTGGGDISASRTFSVGAGAGITVAADSVAVLANNGITANTTGVFVAANTGLVANATGLHVNTAYIATLDAATVGGNTVSDILTTADGYADTAYSNAVSYAGTIAGTAYSNAVSTASADATSKAATAYSNAVSFATTIAGTAYTNATSFATTIAGTAYSNAVSYAATVAGTAYSNAIAIADGYADTAYANAMADTLTRNGTYTGDNIFQGLSTFQGNVDLGNATSDTVTVTARIDSAVVPSANATYDLGTDALRWNNVYADAITAVDGNFSGDLSVDGDLTVSGNVTYVSASELSITDPLIHLAANNESSDTVDIGFIGHYSPDGGSTKEHTGFYRDATNKQFYLFNGSQQADLDTGTTVVDSGATGYTKALLNAYINAGALVSNSTVTNVTANSTVSVAIVANTLSLTTALAGTSGGTGLVSYTAEDILVANSTNGFRKLGIGSEGYVLQSQGGALVYDTLDGGTF